MTNHSFIHGLLIGLFLLTPVTALAERADREKPIALVADKISIDDIKRTQILEGNVTLTQGTLTIRSDKIVIQEDQYGFQRGIAYGGPKGLARFRQKREGTEEWIEGEAERIEYDTRTEVAELFQRAWVKNAEDQLKGDYIWYNAVSEQYLASSTTGQTRMQITPKSKQSAAPTTPAPPPGLKLKPTGGITPPEHP